MKKILMILGVVFTFSSFTAQAEPPPVYTVGPTPAYTVGPTPEYTVSPPVPTVEKSPRPPFEPPEIEFYKAKAVFIGKVYELKEDVPLGRDQVFIKVERVFKGQIGPEFIYEQDHYREEKPCNETSCYFGYHSYSFYEFREGNEYLIFLPESIVGKSEISYNSNSALVRQSTATIQLLEGLQHFQNGLLHGSLPHYGPWEANVKDGLLQSYTIHFDSMDYTKPYSPGRAALHCSTTTQYVYESGRLKQEKSYNEEGQFMGELNYDIGDGRGSKMVRCTEDHYDKYTCGGINPGESEQVFYESGKLKKRIHYNKQGQVSGEETF